MSLNQKRKLVEGEKNLYNATLVKINYKGLPEVAQLTLSFLDLMKRYNPTDKEDLHFIITMQQTKIEKLLKVTSSETLVEELQRSLSIYTKLHDYVAKYIYVTNDN